MKLLPTICLGVLLLPAMPVWSQTDNASQAAASASPADDTPVQNDDRMPTPPPVSGQSYPTALGSEERSNYLNGGVSFTAAYMDKAVVSDSGLALSDASYSIAPNISLDETTTRLHVVLAYAPGYTFYHRTTSRDEADQNASLTFSYRLTPHVSFTAHDDLQKTSNAFNPGDIAVTGPVTGGTEGPNFSVYSPIAARLANSGNVGLAYQFDRNSMVGVGGSYSNLHYPDLSGNAGLYDSASQSGLAYYTHRLSKTNYLGVSYQFQRLVAYPTVGVADTHTQSVLLFDTFYVTPKFSVSLYGGPQYAETSQLTPLPAAHSWTPQVGASLGWQRRYTSFALGYTHSVSGGGGLAGAVEMDGASASIRQRIARTLTGTVSGGYAQNKVLVVSSLPGAIGSGHSILGNAELEQQLGQQVRVELGYSRIHQNYATAALLPDTNREFVSISYQFSKALGR
jgi:hypothetical protein